LAEECIRAVLPIFAILVALILALFATKSAMIGIGAGAIGALALSVFDGSELRHAGFARVLAIYGIPGRLLFADILLASYQSHRRGKVEWKGREYPVGTPRASK
jgi:hypothetical protein